VSGNGTRINATNDRDLGSDVDDWAKQRSAAAAEQRVWRAAHLSLNSCNTFRGGTRFKSSMYERREPELKKGEGKMCLLFKMDILGTRWAEGAAYVRWWRFGAPMPHNVF